MKNPFNPPSVEEKTKRLLAHETHALFEARLDAIAHDHYIQRIEASIAYLEQVQKAFAEKKGEFDDLYLE